MRSVLHHTAPVLQHQPAPILDIREHVAVHPAEDAFDADRDADREVVRFDRRRPIRRVRA